MSELGCTVNHTRLASPRANLNFTNHVTVAFIPEVNYCPKCGEKL